MSGNNSLNTVTPARRRVRGGMRRFQRAWWRDLQTLFVVAEDGGKGAKKGDAAKDDDAEVFLFATEEDGTGTFMLESEGRGGSPQTAVGTVAVPVPPQKIHPNLDDLLDLHGRSLSILADDDTNTDSEPESDYSSESESVCSSSPSLDSGSCSSRCSEATAAAGRPGAHVRPSPSECWRRMLANVDVDVAKVNEVCCVGLDERGKRVYVTVLSPPPPPPLPRQKLGEGEVLVCP